MAGDDRKRYDMKRQVLLFCKLFDDLLLKTTSWLRSTETTWLRSTSQRARELVVRNIPASTAELAYIEAARRPNDLSFEEFIREGPHFNEFSPLRSWRFRCKDVIMADAPRRLRRDKGFVKMVLTRHGSELEFVDESLKSDRDVVLAALTRHGRALQFADEKMRSDRDIVLVAVKQNGGALRFAHSTFRSDRDVVFAAIAQLGSALQFAHSSFRSDRDVVLAAVKKHGHGPIALKFADESLRGDRDVVLAAVEQNGRSLEFASEALKNDREVVLAAVKIDGTFALKFAAKSLQSDPGILFFSRPWENKKQHG